MMYISVVTMHLVMNKYIATGAQRIYIEAKDDNTASLAS